MAKQEGVIGNLIRQLRDITATTTDDREIIRKITPLAHRMAEDTGWVKSSFYDCDEDQGFGISILHEGSDNSLLVEAIAWLPDRGVMPHNHQTWGVVVGLDGDEKNVNWERRDDGSRPGYADLAVRNEIVVRRGDVLGFLPDDIHSVRNEGEKPSLSLHIYGRNLAHIDRSEFEPVYSGRQMRARRPPCGESSRRMSPPWLRAMSRAIARPRPVPPVSGFRDSSNL
jgi:predicted metal-dependent enzyme (double-stranded beta helix superfamily)